MTGPAEGAGPEVVAVCGPTPGSAKTTSALGLAVALAAAGRTVLLVDLDPRGPAGATLVRGPHAPGGSRRLLLEARVARETLAATEIPGLYLLAADPALADVEAELALDGDSRTRLRQGLETLAGLTPRFDTVILDCPPSLGLVTLNALAAAHRVLVTVAADDEALEGLPALLHSMQLLRAGLSRPLLGVHLLLVPGPAAHAPALVTWLRRRYPRLVLQTEVPLDRAVTEAAGRSQPLLAHAPRSPAARAYLDLAAEWLAPVPPAGPRAREAARAQARQAMERRIGAWRADPSSLLYDPEEAARHPDGEALADLLGAVAPPAPRTWSPGRIALGGGLVLALLLALPPWGGPSVLGPAGRYMDRWRLEAGAQLIGARHFWHAGSALLARSDQDAYRALLLGARLIEWNRPTLLACGLRARAGAQPVPCTLAVGPLE